MLWGYMIMDFKEFYRGKRILVTGADGFMGSHLTERLLGYNANITAFVHNKELKNLNHVKNKLNIISGDIEDKKTTELIIKNSPEIIFHLAVDGYIRNSIENPLSVNRTNLDGTLNVLEAARQLINQRLERLVFASSCVVYGARPYPINEKGEFKPSTPYAASKAAAELYCYSYAKTYNLPITIIRPFNVYGPRHTKDVIPLFIEKALKNEEIKLDGGGKATRDFTYVDDMINSFLITGVHEKAIGEAVNFGTGKDISVRELAEKIIKYCNSDSKLINMPERPGQDLKLCCDNTKAKELFGWQPKISIDEGLKLNIEWNKNRIKNEL